jgi:hypothetical protein
VNFFLGHFSSEDDIPELGRDSEPKEFPAIVVLIMVQLQSVEIGALGLRGVKVVEAVVGEVIDQVPDQEPRPKGKVEVGIWDPDHLEHSEVPNQKGEHGQRRRVNNTFAKLGKKYGSAGSM